ncbi:MAG TPA: SGNH/GDSL hydrolase family protein [Micromonosporaceae bacterium]|nr:SGNH/GDSL hydrolase family protein [Micromonosporaceae bacterium]
MVMGLARRAGRAAAITVAAAAVGSAVTLVTEAVVARARRYGRPDPNLAIRTSHGDPNLAPTRLVLLGDSSALGVGVGRVADTVGGRLAELLVADGYRVELSSVAVMGSRSADLATQVARALLGPSPDVAVILVGANDATGLRRPLDAATALGEAVARLCAAGVPVVVGTCPDLGALRAIAPPLRQLLGLLGRRVARAQEAAVRAAGGVPVDLAALTGAVFRADAGTLSADGYHPSADGYRVWAHALTPAVRDAVGVAPHR